MLIEQQRQCQSHATLAGGVPSSGMGCRTFTREPRRLAFCAYHDVHSHDTEDCRELKRLRDGRPGRRGGRNDRGAGNRWDNHSGGGNLRQERSNLPRQADAQAGAALPLLLLPHPRRNDVNQLGGAIGGYQEPRAVACILGGAQAPASNRHFKQFSREVNAALPRPEAAWPLKWLQYAITFDSKDHPKSTTAAGASSHAVHSHH
jgi:hypothetical protein